MPTKPHKKSQKEKDQTTFLPDEEPSQLQITQPLVSAQGSRITSRETGSLYNPSHKYKRTVEDLRNLASMFWPPELSQLESEISIIPRLLETQDQFISILSVDVANLESLFQIINASKLSANMFVKHLTVLADFGGEMLQRINNQFSLLFPLGKIDFLWNDVRHTYRFKVLPLPGVLNNQRLGITGKRLLDQLPLNELLQDVITLLIFGNACVIEQTAQVLEKCEIGGYLGQPDRLAKFIKQRYIWVSRITRGAQANSLGQIAQGFVRDYLQANLGVDKAEVLVNGNLPGVTHTDELANRPTTFDIVVSAGSKNVAVEVSFQVTTNSVIERKAGQARSRYEQAESLGYKIAYVIDGAGNFQRESAISVLCSYSHCTVAFSLSELGVLCEFIREYLL